MTQSHQPLTRPTFLTPTAFVHLDLNSSPQENLLSIARTANEPKTQRAIVGLLESFLERAKHPELAFSKLNSFVSNHRDPSLLLKDWLTQSSSFELLFSCMDTDQVEANWLSQDPDAWDWLNQANQHPDPSNWTEQWLVAELAVKHHDSDALALLRKYYYRQNLLAWMAYRLDPKGGWTFRKQLTNAACVLLRCIFDRLQQTHPCPGLEISLFGLNALTYDLLGAAKVWELFAIYEATRGSLDSTPIKRQQAAERQIEWFMEWLRLVTDDSIQLKWPLAIQGSESSTGQINLRRHWLDAFPSLDDPGQTPLLMSARWVAGSQELANRFLDEADSLMFPSFRTEVDLRYLAAYFRRSLLRIQDATAWNSTSSKIQTEEILKGCQGLLDVLRLVHRHRGLHDRSDGSTPWSNKAAAILGDCQLLEKLALGMDSEAAATEQLVTSLGFKCEEWFQDAVGMSSQLSNPELLVLNPNDPPLDSSKLLQGFGFPDPEHAARLFNELGREEIEVLSSRNCRYQLSRIAAPLLDRISASPNPDLTLQNLASSSRSLGGKGVLWELFAFHSPSMDLYTRLCGSSPYLVQILNSNPGMIDDLLDSLMLYRIPDMQTFRANLRELCRGRQEVESAVLGFRNSMHLAIGVRDILGRENITEVHRAVADVHEACLMELTNSVVRELEAKHGRPRSADGAIPPFALLTLGKLASREANYHSDISMLLVYDSDKPSDARFFQQLGQKLIQVSNRITRYGRLFELKVWPFAMERGSTPAWSKQEIFAALETGDISIEHRMNLYTARVLGESPFAGQLEADIEAYLHRFGWTNQHGFELIEWRRELEKTASQENIKRGWGGTLDVETLAHLFYAKHLHTPRHPWLRGTVERLEALRKNGVLSPNDALQLRDAYYFLRSVESGLRLMNTKHKHDLPVESGELRKLAYVLQISSTDELLESCEHYRKIILKLSQNHYARVRAEALAMPNFAQR